MTAMYICPKCGEDRHSRLSTHNDKMICSTCDTMFDMDDAGDTIEMFVGVWLQPSTAQAIRPAA